MLYSSAALLIAVGSFSQDLIHCEWTMGSRPKWKPRRTLIDLYNERDYTRWYWRVAAIVSACAVMIGYTCSLTWYQVPQLIVFSYLIFPSTFDNNPNLNVSYTSATVIASILLAIGYAISMSLWFICHSSLFRLDVIFAYWIPRRPRLLPSMNIS